MITKADGKVHLRVLRTTQMRAWLTCPRKFRLLYVDGYTPVEDAHALRFGTVWHVGCEGYLGAIRDGGPTAEGLARIEVAAGEQRLQPIDLARLRPLYAGYCAKWEAQDRATLVVLSVEREYEEALCNPDTGHASRRFRFAGRVDGEALLEGEHVLVEHKTTSEDITDGSAYWRARRIDAQQGNYLGGTGAVAGLYDVVAKPKQRLLLATREESRKVRRDGALYASQRDRDETLEELEARIAAAIAKEPSRYYVRKRTVRLDEELLEAARDRWQIAQAIGDALRTGNFPRNTSACFFPGGSCAFAGACAGEVDLDDPSRFDRRVA